MGRGLTSRPTWHCIFCPPPNPAPERVTREGARAGGEEGEMWRMCGAGRKRKVAASWLCVST